MCRKKSVRVSYWWEVRRYVLAGILAVGMAVGAGAQAVSHSPQQLITLIKNSQPDTSHIKLLLALGEYYFDTEWNYRNKVKVDSALQYLHRAAWLSDSLQAPALKQRSLTLMGYYYFRCDDVKKAKDCFMQVIANYRKWQNNAGEAEAWTNFALRSPLVDHSLDTIAYRLEQALAIYRQLKQAREEAVVMKEIAFIHIRQGRLQLAEDELLKVLDMQKAARAINLHYTYDMLASVSALKGNYNIAIRYEMEAIKGMEETGDKSFGGDFYSALGNFYGELGEVEKSIHWYHRSLEVVKRNSNRGAYRYISNAYTREDSNNTFYSLVRKIVQGMVRQHKGQEAFTFLRQSTNEYPAATDFASQLQAGAMGDCYRAMKQYDTAEKYYLKAINLEVATRQVAELRKEYYNISNLYIDAHHFTKAAHYLNRLVAMPAGVISVSMLKDIHRMLFQVDSASRNYIAAIAHYQKHKALNDSIFTEKKIRQIEELQIQYETAKKEQDIRLLRNQASLHQHELQRATLIRNLTFGGIALLLVIVALLYNSYRLKQRSNQQLQTQQKEINEKNTSLQNLVNEKEWLLKEVHHRVKNNLQMITSLLNSQSAYLNNNEALNAIRDSQHRVQAMSLIHQKLYQSKNVSAIGMQVYIHELVQYLRDSFNTRNRIRFEIRVAPVALGISQAVPLGLILNEAITNAIKYAFGDNDNGLITIAMEHEAGGHLLLTIADNGAGLPPDFDTTVYSSLGMSLMQGLSEDIGGHFAIGDNHGTAITIRFPHQVHELV